MAEEAHARRVGLAVAVSRDLRTAAGYLRDGRTIAPPIIAWEIQESARRFDPTVSTTHVGPLVPAAPAAAATPEAKPARVEAPAPPARPLRLPFADDASAIAVLQDVRTLRKRVDRLFAASTSGGARKALLRLYDELGHADAMLRGIARHGSTLPPICADCDRRIEEHGARDVCADYRRRIA